MRFKHRALLAFALLATAGSPKPATASPYDTEVLVKPRTASTFIEWEEVLSELPPAASPAVSPQPIVVGPMHGELVTESTDGLLYTPDSSFWKLGTDSFVVRVTSLDPDAFVTVTLQAADFRETYWVDQTFEGLIPPLEGGASVSSDAAIAGDWGLRAVAGFEDAVFPYVAEPVLPPGAEGNTEELKLRPPPDSPVGGGTSPIVIYSLDRAFEDPAADLLITFGSSDWEISARLYDSAGTYTTQPFELGEAEHRLRLDWWNASQTQTGGLRLWVDGELAGSIIDRPEWDAGEARRRVGAMVEVQEMMGTVIDIDDVRGSSAELARAAFEPILRDGFDNGLGSWIVSAAPYIETTTEAALVGPESLKIGAVHQFDGFLLDPSPVAETSVGVRMQLSIDALSLPMGGTLEFLALSGADLGTGSDQALLMLQNTFAGYRLEALALDGLGWQSTPFMTLTAGTHTVELRWQAADPLDDNGWVQLWVDGVPGSRLGGLGNAGVTIESMRLGAWDVSSTNGGILFVDAFESWAFVPTL